MGLLTFLIVVFVGGLIVGALARLALPGPDPMSIPMTALLGIGARFSGASSHGSFSATQAGSCSRSWARCCCSICTGAWSSTVL